MVVKNYGISHGCFRKSVSASVVYTFSSISNPYEINQVPVDFELISICCNCTHKFYLQFPYVLVDKTINQVNQLCKSLSPGINTTIPSVINLSMRNFIYQLVDYNNRLKIENHPLFHSLTLVTGSFSIRRKVVIYEGCFF